MSSGERNKTSSKEEDDDQGLVMKKIPPFNKDHKGNREPKNQLSVNNNDAPTEHDAPETEVRHRRISRRNNSVSRVDDHQEKEHKERSSQSDKPCHKPQDSLFTRSSGFTNYRGFFNLLVILLVLSNLRVAVENVIKYGLLVSPGRVINMLNTPTILPSILIMVGVNGFILMSLFIEKVLVLNKNVPEIVSKAAMCLNGIGCVVIPAVIVYTKDVHPVGSSIALSGCAIAFLKIVSYHHVNHWCRLDLMKKFSSPSNQRLNQKVKRFRSFCKADDDEPDDLGKVVGEHFLDEPYTSNDCIEYPDNLNVKDIYYFMVVPTLCYELNFPRSPRIRKMFLLKRGLEMIFLFQLNIGLIQQWVMPLVANSYEPLTNMNLPRMLERLLKLAIPNHIIWLIMFYWLFHSTLNFMAELTRFSDRIFYKDWWNANSVPYFWSNWNIPVHKWCLRHLYKPLLGYGFSRVTASCVVFLVSAFFHEYLVSVPLKMFKIWAFAGMMAQVPFGRFVSKLEKYPSIANGAVWLSLILGQPLCIFMYYHDFLADKL